MPLVDLLRTHVRTAMNLELSPVADASALPPAGTRFGGAPYAEQGETWPTCPGCKKTLTFIGQFDTQHGQIISGPQVGLFTFFYCWECMPSGLESDISGSWVARIHPEPDIRTAIPIAPQSAPPQITRPCAVRLAPMPSHPDWDEVELRYPDLHKLSCGLAPSESWAPYRAAVKDVVGDYSIATQMGGYGNWIQSAPRRLCRECKGPLSFVLQIDSLGEAGCDWGLSGLAYLLVCPQHLMEWGLDIQRT